MENVETGSRGTGEDNETYLTETRIGVAGKMYTESG